MLVIVSLLAFLLCFVLYSISIFFFFNDTATTEIYTLSLHDALPIFLILCAYCFVSCGIIPAVKKRGFMGFARSLLVRVSLCALDRKSTRLNSSHLVISYAVFCLKKKKIKLVATLIACSLVILKPYLS